MNAKEEFLVHINDATAVLCAEVTFGDEWDDDRKTFLLKRGYSREEYKVFLNSLDFGYDNGFGGQELFGMIWYADGTWSTRGEYDGSEWWERHECPPIPEYL